MREIDGEDIDYCYSRHLNRYATSRENMIGSWSSKLGYTRYSHRAGRCAVLQEYGSGLSRKFAWRAVPCPRGAKLIEACRLSIAL